MTTTRTVSADEQEVRRTVDLLLEPGEVVELRALDVRRGGNGFRFTASGYFDDREKLVEEAVKLSQRAKGVYLVPNVKPELLARASNRVRECGKGDSCTSDDDTLPRRKWFFVDCDPVRPSGISSTDRERDAAGEKAQEVWSTLLDLGFPDPAIYASSGNGRHLLYRVDLPADDGGLLRQCLEALDFRFGDDRVTVDTSVHNRARPLRFYGTVNRKGDDVPDRPHRVSRIEWTPPDGAEVVRVSALEELARWLPQEEPSPTKRTASGKAFDLDGWIQEHGVPVGPPSDWKGGRKWVFPVCPWDSAHSNRSAFILQFPSGGISAGCLHNGCRGMEWRDLRLIYEPDAYEHEHGDSIPCTGAGNMGEAASEVVSSMSSTLTHKDLVTGELPPVPWLVEGLIPKGGLCLLAGDSGVGKSWLGFHLGQTVASELPFLGKFPVEKGAVLYLDAESGENLIRRRFKKLWKGLEEANPDLDPDIPFSVLLSAVDLDADGLQALTERIRRECIRLVVLDPMIHFGSADENDSRAMASFLEGIRQVSRDTGAAFLLVHHVRKESRLASNAPGQMIRGSSAIRAVMDSVLYVRRLNDGKLQVEHDKSRQAEAVPRFLVEVTDPDEETTSISYAGESGTAESRRELAEEAILRTIADTGGTAKRQLIVEQCKAEGVSEKTVNNTLSALVEASRLTKVQRGKPVFYSLPETSNKKAPMLEEEW
ncbi:MAG: AAA family ATPase [Armatimonadetes bacterium]|nr:AAA family ATPase [Armatimonadota bacterium]